MELREQDIHAICHFNPANKKFLCVVGKGENEHLEIYQVSWLGRIFMKIGLGKFWLRLNNAAMTQVAEHINKLFISSNPLRTFGNQFPQIREKLEELKEKISAYRDNRLPYTTPAIEQVYKKLKIIIDPYEAENIITKDERFLEQARLYSNREIQDIEGHMYFLKRIEEAQERKILFDLMTEES